MLGNAVTSNEIDKEQNYYEILEIPMDSNESEINKLLLLRETQLTTQL